jgi:hypothetical protein
MIQFRLRPPCSREFFKDVYRPGIISLARLLWGSLGTGLFLCGVALFSEACGVGLLYPPLAATCFINSTCIYLRVARPKQVIVGHFVSTLGGLLAVQAVPVIVNSASLLIPLKLGGAVCLAAVFMQIFDADHPPAAATAAIPAILPIPADPLLLPLHMSWGAVLIVVFSLFWNRIWIDFPAPEDPSCPRSLGLAMSRAEAWGLIICILATVLMGLKSMALPFYHAGLGVMGLGLTVLMLHHFFDLAIVLGDTSESRL